MEPGESRELTPGEGLAMWLKIAIGAGIVLGGLLLFFSGAALVFGFVLAVFGL